MMTGWWQVRHGARCWSAVYPGIDVDTTDGYRPALEEIVAFIDGWHPDGPAGLILISR
jgi:hypothetical protein